MDQKWKKDFFEELKEHFGGMTTENVLVEQDDGEFTFKEAVEQEKLIKQL